MMLPNELVLEVICGLRGRLIESLFCDMVCVSIGLQSRLWAPNGSSVIKKKGSGV